MSQVLSFMDFSSVNAAVLSKWRATGVRERYSTEVAPPVSHTAPLFFDSGGFKLLWSDKVDLSRYGLSIATDGPETILGLQRDFGGDVIATLDYPLPPGLATVEAEERMHGSIENAVATARALSANPAYRPFLFVAAHGQDRASMARYVRRVFRRFREEGVQDYPFGLAVGSLVPLRGSKKYAIIVDILHGVQEGIPDDMRGKVPIHVFGMTGNLVPILAYLGIDSFDSSTYVQEARSLGYIDPVTKFARPILEMDEVACACRICRHMNIEQLHAALTSDVRNKPQECGHYKSKYYADIALHNLEMDLGLVRDTRQAIRADALQEYLLAHVDRFPSLRPALATLAREDEGLRARLGRAFVDMAPAPPAPRDEGRGVRAISLKYVPESFDILANGYQPPAGKRILLIIPCSGGKPYSLSRSHRLIAERLALALGEKTLSIHKVTLSGLYGPVPEEHEGDEAVLGYDFRLDPTNRAQIELVADRLARYIERHAASYDAYLGYATSNAYRTVLERVGERVGHFDVLPTKPRTRRLTEFYRQTHIAELVSSISALVDA